LVRCVAITTFELDRHFADGVDQLSPREVACVRLLSDLLAGMLNAFLMPVYTVKQGDLLLDYFALPATKVILNVIQIHPRILDEAGFRRRQQIWPGEHRGPILRISITTLKVLCILELRKKLIQNFGHLFAPNSFSSNNNNLP
jgi:hypothetical protein